MKVHTIKPVDEIVIFKVENPGHDYEIFHISVTRIGGARRIDPRLYVTEDGHKLRNLPMCVEHFAAQANLSHLVEEGPSKAAAKSVKGLDMVAAGQWPKFCEMRDIDPRDVKAMQKTYQLAAGESILLAHLPKGKANT